MFFDHRAQRAEVVHWIILAILGILIALAITMRANAEPPGPLPPPAPPKATMIVSPWTGVFRASEYPGAPPLVTVGSKVEPNTIVGVIDTVATAPPSGFFRVPAGMRGTVVSILVADGQMVSLGDPLFEVMPSPAPTPPPPGVK